MRYELRYSRPKLFMDCKILVYNVLRFVTQEQFGAEIEVTWRLQACRHDGVCEHGECQNSTTRDTLPTIHRFINGQRPDLPHVPVVVTNVPIPRPKLIDATISDTIYSVEKSYVFSD